MIGSLDRIVMKDKCPLNSNQKIELISGVAKGIFHLHRNNIIHRDLATRNILVRSSELFQCGTQLFFFIIFLLDVWRPAQD